MIGVDSSAWIDFFNGFSTLDVERLDGRLGITPIAIGDLTLVEVMQGFRQETHVATARQLFRSLALLPMLEPRNAWKAADNYRERCRRSITVRKTCGCPGSMDRSPPRPFSSWLFCPTGRTSFCVASRPVFSVA